MGGRYFNKDLGKVEIIFLLIFWLIVAFCFLKPYFDQPNQSKPILKQPTNNVHNFPEVKTDFINNVGEVKKTEGINKDQNLEKNTNATEQYSNLTKEDPEGAKLPVVQIDELSKFENFPSSGITLIPKDLLIQYLKDNSGFSYIKEQYDNNVLMYTKHLFVKITDLNNDNRPDFLIINYNRNYCGSAGCELEIYSGNENGFVGILNTTDTVLINPSGEEIEIKNSISNGYKDIVINEANYEKSVLKFDGFRYKRYSM